MEMYKEGRLDEVTTIWENEQETAQFDEWSFIAVMNCFYSLKRYDKCVAVYRDFHKAFPDSDKLDDKLGWSLYQTSIKNFDFKSGNVTNLCKQVIYILQHSTSSEYSPKWCVVKFMLNAMERGNLCLEQGYLLADRYLDYIDPNTLSTVENLIQLQNGESRRLASDRETWYSEKSKVLLKLQKYEECIQCCDAALRGLYSFHSNNDSWFRYRKAQCLYALGRAEEAKACIQKILEAGFSHWCLLQLMFELERDAGNTDKAMSYAGACATADSSHEMRVSFYPELADFLDANGKNTEAMLHRRLVVLLREENGWGRKAYQDSWQFTPEIAAMDKEAILKKLIPFWRELRDKDKEYLTGTVERIFVEGHSGLILAEDGQLYYFNTRDIHGKNHNVKKGMKMRFTLVDRLDKSKGIVKKNAVEISII